MQLASERHKLTCSLRDNEIKNHKHLCIESENLSLTIHHLDKSRSLPRKANYRQAYRGFNEDLFDNLDDGSDTISTMAYVYLLHEGWRSLDKVFFAFPSVCDNRILYSEPLEIQHENLVKEEETPSKVEEQIRKSGSK